MPSWLWRAWLGPLGRAPRALLDRRPRRRRLPPPPPPEGLPGPAFIVLSKLQKPEFIDSDAGVQKLIRFSDSQDLDSITCVRFRNVGVLATLPHQNEYQI